MMRILKFEEMIDKVNDRMEVHDKIYHSLEQNNLRIKDIDEKATRKLAEMRTSNKYIEDKVDDILLKKKILFESFKKVDQRLTDTSHIIHDCLNTYDDRFNSTIGKMKIENVSIMDELKSLSLKAELNSKTMADYKNQVTEHKTEFLKYKDNLSRFDDVNEKFLETEHFEKYKLENDRNMANLKLALNSRIKKMLGGSSKVLNFGSTQNLDEVSEEDENSSDSSQKSTLSHANSVTTNWDMKTNLAPKKPEEINKILSSMRGKKGREVSKPIGGDTIKTKTDPIAISTSLLKSDDQIKEIKNDSVKEIKLAQSHRRMSSQVDRKTSFRNSLQPIHRPLLAMKESEVFRIGEEETSQVNSDLNLHAKVVEIMAHVFQKHGDLMALHEYTNDKEVLFKKIYKITKPKGYMDEDENQRVKILQKFGVLKKMIGNKCKEKGSKLVPLQSPLTANFEPNSAQIPHQGRKRSVFYTSLKSQLDTGMITKLRSHMQSSNRQRQGSIQIIKNLKSEEIDLKGVPKALKIKKISSELPGGNPSGSSRKLIESFIANDSSEKSEESNEGGETEEKDLSLVSLDINENGNGDGDREVNEENKNQERSPQKESETSSDLMSDQIRENVQSLIDPHPNLPVQTAQELNSINEQKETDSESTLQKSPNVAQVVKIPQIPKLPRNLKNSKLAQTSTNLNFPQNQKISSLKVNIPSVTIPEKKSMTATYKFPNALTKEKSGDSSGSSSENTSSKNKHGSKSLKDEIAKFGEEEGGEMVIIQENNGEPIGLDDLAPNVLERFDIQDIIINDAIEEMRKQSHKLPLLKDELVLKMNKTLTDAYTIQEGVMRYLKVSKRERLDVSSIVKEVNLNIKTLTERIIQCEQKIEVDLTQILKFLLEEMKIRLAIERQEYSDRDRMAANNLFEKKLEQSFVTKAMKLSLMEYKNSIVEIDGRRYQRSALVDIREKEVNNLGIELKDLDTILSRNNYRKYCMKNRGKGSYTKDGISSNFDFINHANKTTSTVYKREEESGDGDGEHQMPAIYSPKNSRQISHGLKKKLKNKRRTVCASVNVSAENAGQLI